MMTINVIDGWIHSKSVRAMTTAKLNHVIVVLVVVLASNPLGEVLADSTTCAVCPGDQLTFECMTFGGIATIWHGSAFDCGYQDGQKLPDEIVLRRSLFNSQVERRCGSNEQIIAQTVGVVNNTYFTSQLNVTVSSDMNNRTIECDTESADGSRMMTNMIRLIVTTGVVHACVILILFCNIRLSHLL